MTDFEFSCPVCGEMLKKYDRTLKCKNGHSFDLAKQGYVNLLQSQSSSAKRHGDDKIMVKARYDFLSKGYYDGLVQLITNMLEGYVADGMRLVDLGCGECYYTAAVSRKFPELSIGGIDISKQALICAAKRDAMLKLAVASIFNLPVANEYCDIVMSVFAPYSAGEIARVLGQNGIWLRAYPLEKHLMGLKSMIYDRPYLNEVDREAPEGFVLLDRGEHRASITLDKNEEIVSLFKMTPYFYKTSKKDQQKLEKMTTLETEIEFGVDIFKKL